MKNILKVNYFILISIGMIAVSCKKGENDPFLSLKTRDSRISGEWELKSMLITDAGNSYDNYDTSSYTYTEIYENGTYAYNYTSIYTSNGTTDTYQQGDTITPYEYSMEIEKSGNLILAVTEDQETAELKSLWYWLDTGKKKTILVVNGSPYYVDRLTNNELVLKADGSLKGMGDEPDNNYSYGFKFSLEMVYEKTD